ncbi:serine/threonine protein kinase [Paenarthrobacter sp. CM16]|uniref:serine/threonine-protein kinase n=1 Tax=Paenarthrobacter sp. CM16 TaxID=2738447 RepID=UPI001552A917|nr:serine/threonine-protein kinase [Paenarthrobacter sp. CM16]NQD88999.1 serine/threonine protein kinase [Paenarthrobacter sp. CM16]
MSSKRPPAPPPPIPGFNYISLLGSGGFSDVYLYEQDRPRRKVAVKVLLSDLKTDGARRRFESEANLMAQLSSHPYIVTIFEAEITEDGHSYLAMEYCSKPSLDVRYRRQRFTVDEVLAVGIQVASAVETAHRAGIVHRDIKPANILVTDYNRPALTDFGISGTIGADTEEDDAGMSIPWSPPEQFRGGAVDGVPLDIWALGATLYTLLAGRSPFVLPGQDNSQRELISRITNSPLPRLGRADVPESLELVLAAAMAKSPESRYSSAHAFALALQRIQAELNLSVTPFEVLEETGHGDEQHPDVTFEETRVRSIAPVEPDASKTATGSVPTFPDRTLPSTVPHGFRTPTRPTQPGNSPQALQPEAPQWAPAQFRAQGPYGASDGGTGPSGTTGLRGWQPSRPQNNQGAKATRSGAGPATRRDLPPAGHRKRNLLAASGAAVLVLAIVVGVVLGIQAQPKVEPTKPGVPDVVDFVGAKDPEKPDFADFRWKNPQPQPGDTYMWRYRTADIPEGQYDSIKEPNVRAYFGWDDEHLCIQVIIVRADGSTSPGEEGSIACAD